MKEISKPIIITNHNPKEVEVNINREAILDCFIVSWNLPEEQK